MRNSTWNRHHGGRKAARTRRQNDFINTYGADMLPDAKQRPPNIINGVVQFKTPPSSLGDPPVYVQHLYTFICPKCLERMPWKQKAKHINDHHQSSSTPQKEDVTPNKFNKLLAIAPAAAAPMPNDDDDKPKPKIVKSPAIRTRPYNRHPKLIRQSCRNHPFIGKPGVVFHNNKEKYVNIH